MATIEDKNIVHKGVRGLVKNSLRLTDAVWKRLLKQNRETFYVRADWKKLEHHVSSALPVLDRKRKLSFRFSLTAMLDLILERYEPFLSSWLDSYLIAGGGSLHTSRDIDLDLNSQVGRFVRYINDNTYGQASAEILRDNTALNSNTSVSVDGVLTNLLKSTYGIEAFSFVPVRFSEVDATSRHMNSLAGTYLFCRFLPQAKFDYNPDERSYGVGNDFSQTCTYEKFLGLDRSCNLSTTTSNIVVFKVREELLSDYQPSTTNHTGRTGDDSNTFLLRDVHYLKGSLPTDHDVNYNNQMWLPLLDACENTVPFYDAHMSEPLTRHTHCLWSVGFVSDGNNGVANRVTFLGEYSDSRITPDMVKASLSDYQLTSDESFRGVGKIYVDLDGVCYCPLTGAALECVVDLCPRVDHPTNGTHTYVL